MSNSLFYLKFLEAPILTQDSCIGHMFRFYSEDYKCVENFV